MSQKLPPDPDGRNDERAARIDAAFKAYAKAADLYEDGEFLDAEDSILSDMLCDIQHWCDRNEVDFDMALLTGEVNYQAETEDD